MSVNVERISRIGSERAIGGNNVVTRDGVCHVVWQDVSREGYLNRVRSYRYDTGRWTEPATLNVGVDNHARPVITVDHEGRLHVVLSGHGTPVTYRRSAGVNDSSEWTPEQPAGSGTYPILVCAPDGTLFLTMRPERPFGADLFIKEPGEPWRCQARLIRRTERYLDGYAAYHSHLGIGRDGDLHFVCYFYEGLGTTEQRGLHQALCYVRSPDRGMTWQKADDTPVAIPAQPEAMDVLYRTTGRRHEPMPPPEVSCLGLMVASDGEVVMLCISGEERTGQVLLHSHGRGGWDRREVLELEQAWPDMRPVDGRLGMRADGSLYALMQLKPGSQGPGGKPTRDRDTTGDRTVWLVSDPARERFRAFPELEPGTVANRPAPEPPLGANVVPAGQLPAFTYFDGSSGYPRGLRSYFEDVQDYIRNGDLVTNNVYWVAPRTQPP